MSVIGRNRDADADDERCPRQPQRNHLVRNTKFIEN